MQRSIIAPAERVTNRRWGIAVLLGIGMFIATLDGLYLGVGNAGPRDVGAGALQISFVGAFCVLSIPAGMLVDRVGVTLAGRWVSAVWSVAALIAAVSIDWIAGSRALTWIADTMLLPVVIKATGYWFPIRERGLATAIVVAGKALATALTVAVVAAIATRFGWRMTFGSVAALNVAYFIAFFALYRSPSETASLTHAERTYIVDGGAQAEGRSAANATASLLSLLGRRKVWGVAIAVAASVYAFSLFATPFVSSGHAALWAGAVLAELLVGGWLVDALVRRGVGGTRARGPIAVGAMLVGIVAVAAQAAAPAASAWAMLGIVAFAAAAPVLLSIPTLIAPRGATGTLLGIIACCAGIAMAAGASTAASVAQGTDPRTNAFITAAIVLAIGIVAYIALLGRIEPIPEPA